MAVHTIQAELQSMYLCELRIHGEVAIHTTGCIKGNGVFSIMTIGACERLRIGCVLMGAK